VQSTIPPGKASPWDSERKSRSTYCSCCGWHQSSRDSGSVSKNS